MSTRIRLTHCRLSDLRKDDVIRYPGGEHPGWWVVMSSKPAGTNYFAVTLAQPLPQNGDWLKRTTEPMHYFELVEIQQVEGNGFGIGVGVGVPLG